MQSDRAWRGDQLSLESLGPYLEARIDGFGRLKHAKKFPGGQSNPTFLLTTDNGQYVLRKQPPGVLLKSAHAVDREYRVIGALAETAVPVPRAIHLCEDRDLLGTVFFVMSYENGRILWNPTLPGIDRDERGRLFDEMNRVLAALHDVDIDAAGLADFGYPGNYFERQVGRWSKQYRASETGTIKAMDRLIEWLPSKFARRRWPGEPDSRRLPDGQHRFRSRAGIGHGRSGLGTVDPRASLRRPRVSMHATANGVRHRDSRTR